MNHELIVAGAGLVAVVVVAFVRTRILGRRWAQAVEAAAARYGLRVSAHQGTLFTERADGEIAGQGTGIALDDREEGRSTSSRTVRSVEIRLATALPRTLLVRTRALARRSKLQTTDFSQASAQPALTPLDDAALDALLEVRAAPAALAALRAPGVRDTLLGLAADGLELRDGEATLRTRSLPRRRDDVIDHVERLRTLVAALERG